MEYTITGNFVLPSKGKIYTEEIDPNVTLRTMTTAEEMRRMSATDFPYKAMSEIIKACMVSGPELHPYDMCLGDYLFLLYKLRTVTYGPFYKVTTTCPYCTTQNIDTINLDELEAKEFDPEIFNYMQFELPQSKNTVKLKIQTPRMLDTVQEKVKQYRKKSDDKSINPELIYTVSTMIDTIDGEQHNPVEVETWVRQLPMLDTQTILIYADKINEFIGISRKLEVECSICRLTYNTNLRINNEFFRPELDI